MWQRKRRRALLVGVLLLVAGFYVYWKGNDVSPLTTLPGADADDANSFPASSVAELCPSSDEPCHAILADGLSVLTLPLRVSLVRVAKDRVLFLGDRSSRRDSEYLSMRPGALPES